MTPEQQFAEMTRLRRAAWAQICALHTFYASKGSCLSIKWMAAHPESKEKQKGTPS